MHAASARVLPTGQRELGLRLVAGRCAQAGAEWVSEALEGWLEDVPAFLVLALSSIRSKKVGAGGGAALA
jgi:hypothetical protein